MKGRNVGKGCCISLGKGGDTPAIGFSFMKRKWLKEVK